MSQKDFLTRLVIKLKEARIPYMISGSLGSSFHGEPRASNDIDLVIYSKEKQLSIFVKSLGNDYYVNQEAVNIAMLKHTMFNIIDYKTGWKADIIIRKSRPFSVEEFNRRIEGIIVGVQVFVVSPEDSILSKLEWAKESESELQIHDAQGIAVVQWDNLDKEYLYKWSQELNIKDLLDNILKNAKKLQPSKG